MGYGLCLWVLFMGSVFFIWVLFFWCHPVSFISFFLPFDIDCEKSVITTPDGTLLIFSIQNIRRPNFLAFHILEFYKNNVLPSGRFLKITTHIQQVVNIFWHYIIL